MKRLPSNRFNRALSNRRRNRKEDMNANQTVREKAFSCIKKIPITASIAILISGLTLFWTFYQDYRDNQEEMVINSFSPPLDTNVSFDKYAHPQNPYIVTMKIGILLTNTNEKTITLTDYRLEQIAKTDLDMNFEYPSFYSDMNQGFSDETGNNIELPFILQKGESKFLYINIGILINDNVFKKINNFYELENKMSILENKELTYRELSYYLVKAQTDLYGNKREGKAYKIDEKEPFFHYEVDTEKIDFPIFSLTFKSVNGTYFDHNLYEYKYDKF